jgi:hypothetical protein
MKRPLPMRVGRGLRLILLGLLGLVAASAWAQQWEEDDKRWLRLNYEQSSLGVEGQGLRETITGGNSAPVEHKSGYLTPLLGLRFNGSVYHPDFMTFDAAGEGGLGWSQDVVTSGNSTRYLPQNQNLLRYAINANWFNSGRVPYHAAFYANQDHSYNNYDFFNSATIDTRRYGGRASWHDKEAWNLSLDAGRRESDASSLNGFSKTADTFVNFNGLNQRARGSSTLNYSFDNYTSQLDLGGTQQGISQTIGGSDTQTFGARDQLTATLGASYGNSDYTSQQTEHISTLGNLIAHHSDSLESFVNLSYDRNDQTPAENSIFQGMAGVRHKLYESLTSTADVHGTANSFSNAGNNGYNDRYGAGLHEDYLKRLSAFARLNLGGFVVFDHINQQNSGNVLSIINESHVISDTTPASLKNPLVIQATIIVTGPNGFPTYALNKDYTLTLVGEITQLLRVPTSLDLPNNSPIFVSYEAQAPATSAYDAANYGLSARLDLWNTLGLYGRLNLMDNNAPAAALAETLTDWVAGAEVIHRWANSATGGLDYDVRAGVEYEDYDSNFTQYRSTRVFETFNLQPDAGSNLGLDLNQIFYRYPDDRKDTQYRFMLRYNSQLTAWLTWNAEGGYWWQDATGSQQNLASARTGLKFEWGKLTLRAEYQYNYQLTQLTELRTGNYLFLQLRRVF